MTSLSIPDAALELFYNHFEDMFTNAMYFPYQAACLASNQGDFDICEEQFQTTANYYKEWCNELIKGLTTIVNDEEKAELSKSTPPPPPPKVQPKKIFGYWEDWSKSVNTSGNDDLPAYYKTDVTPYTHVAYAFLTLAARPNPENPQPCKWGGKILYENMTATDVTIVMKNQKPAWKNQFNW
jgi:GH18 family chitinase